MSFRRRITLLTTLAVALAVAVVAAASYFLTQSELQGQIDDSLRSRAEGVAGLANALPPPGIIEGRPGGPPRPLGGRDPLFAEGPGERGLAQLVDDSGEILTDDGIYEQRLPTDPAVSLLSSPERQRFDEVELEGESFRVLTLRIGDDLAIQLGRSTAETDDALAQLSLLLLIVAIAGASSAAGLGLLVARAALAPAVQLTETAEEVARTEDLTRRIEIDGDDELARLGTAFNEMLAALERSVGAQKSLVADASHELRTPLTSLRTNIELLTRRPDMPESDREQLLGDLESELEELGRLVDDIVDLARDGTDDNGIRSDVRLDELLDEIVTRARRRAGGRQIVAELEATVLSASPERLDRALGNLVDNAIKWTDDDGSIEVRLAGQEITVADDGPGIDPADLPRIFDRFYRAASARGMPGSGLGLAIVHQVIRSHDGSVTAANRPEGGAIFTVRLPGAAPAAGQSSS